jgi:hypothetical protein
VTGGFSHESRWVGPSTPACPSCIDWVTRMSSRFGAQQQRPFQQGTSSRRRIESGFAPARSDVSTVPASDRTAFTWLVNSGDTDTVEMTGDEIAEAWRQGRLDAGTLVWRQGLLEWTALGAVPQLAIVLDRVRPVRAPEPESAPKTAVAAMAHGESDGGTAPAFPVAVAPEPSGVAPECDSESDDEVTVLRGAPQVTAPSVGVRSPLPPRPSTTLESEQLAEDEVTELWSGQASAQSVEAPAPPEFSVDWDPEQVPEDEVTELWDSQQPPPQSLDAPPPPLSSDDSDPEQLAEDEVTELWGSRQPDSTVDEAPMLSIEEIEFEDVELREDGVTQHWLAEARGVTEPDQALLRGQPVLPRRSPPRPSTSLPPMTSVANGVASRAHASTPQRTPPLPPRISGLPMGERLTQPSMARLVEMRAREAHRVARLLSAMRSARVMKLEFWAARLWWLLALLRTWAAWAVERIGRMRRGGAWQEAGFQSRAAVVLSELRTTVTAAVLASLERLGTWTTRLVSFLRARIAGRMSAWIAVIRR